MFQCCSDTETMEPTEELSPEAVEFCRQLGSQATKVSDIVGGEDKEVYRAIQEGIDRVNSAAISNAQRIQKWTILRKDFSVSAGELGKFSWTSFADSVMLFLKTKYIMLLYSKPHNCDSAVNCCSFYCLLFQVPH